MDSRRPRIRGKDFTLLSARSRSRLTILFASATVTGNSGMYFLSVMSAMNLSITPVFGTSRSIRKTARKNSLNSLKDSRVPFSDRSDYSVKPIHGRYLRSSLTSVFSSLRSNWNSFKPFWRSLVTVRQSSMFLHKNGNRP